MVRSVSLTLSLALAVGCAGGDDDDGAGGGGGEPADGSCEGNVTGAVAGGFSGCQAVINHYPDSAEGDQDGSWIFTLLATPSGGTELDPPLDSIGVNFVIAGAPATGGYTSADALPSTIAFVYAPVDDAFDAGADLSLEVADLEKVAEIDVEGVPTISYQLSGSFEVTVARADGDTVTVNAAF